MCLLKLIMRHEHVVMPLYVCNHIQAASRLESTADASSSQDCMPGFDIVLLGTTNSHSSALSGSSCMLPF